MKAHTPVASQTRPEFVDNRNGNTMATALRSALDWSIADTRRPAEVSVASGYFDPLGFAIIADQLEKVPKVRLLLGAEPLVPPAKPVHRPGNPSGQDYEAAAVEKALEAHSQGMASDRNLLGLDREVDRTVKRLLDYLASGKIEVRRYEKGFLHGKAFILRDDEGVLAGSSNFTGAGLTRNLELNLGRYDPTPVKQVRNWFDDLWAEAVPFDLAAFYKVRYEEYLPYLIYLRVLWERYGNEEEEDARGGPIRLTSFQKDGLSRARRILEKYNGVVFADGVGLGKTFVGGDLIRETVQAKRQRALLVAPAALRDGTWSRFADLHKVYLERVSYEQLAADPSLGGNGAPCLKAKPDEYTLVVVDEAHAFRNPDTDRARALRRLLQGDPPKKLMLMSATPVNNSLWDLYYLITYFVGHDAQFAELGIPSLKQRFKDASDLDPNELRPDALFDVLDATTVRRTRHFVKKYYPHDRVRGPDGVEIPIRFPKPHVKAITYDFNHALPGFFHDFEQALQPEEGHPQLTMARYAPSQFFTKRKLTDEELRQQKREIALVGLLRSGLLKRLESSAFAFRETLLRMIESHDRFLKALDLGYVPKPSALEEWDEPDSDEGLQELLRETVSDPVGHYDVNRLRAAAQNDKELLARFAQAAAKVTPDNDPKLEQLRRQLVAIAEKAEKDGTTQDQKRNDRKVIIFSYYKDTLDWVDRRLRGLLATDKRLAAYRGRLVAVAGDEARDGINRERAVFGFAPKSSEAPHGQDEDRFDILLATDVLAEGQNLQQCRNIINYDLPWNPMRLVQRHGRIDRIGSPHTEVFIWCFFPDRELDGMLQLERRIRNKLAQAAASIGVEDEVIPQGATGEVVYADTHDDIAALRQGDAALFENAGEDPNAHSGEEYRQELRQAIQNGYEAQIRALPWAVGSGFKHVKGQEPGYFFCTRVGERVFLRFLPADGRPIVRDTLQCLRRITCGQDTARALADADIRGIYDAWAAARADVFEEWSDATDPSKLQPKVRPLFRQIADHLRRYPPDVDATILNATLDAVEAPWGARIEKQLRAVWDGKEEDHRKSKRLLEKVKELGLQPYQAPQPLPPIEQDQVFLICWMAVS